MNFIFSLTLITICISWLHISIRFCATTARRSLLWKSFPSKNNQGQHIRNGTGAPHASLASRAISTPCMKSVASWTPRGVTRSSLSRAKFSTSISSGEQAVTRKASSSTKYCWSSMWQKHITELNQLSIYLSNSKSTFRLSLLRQKETKQYYYLLIYKSESIYDNVVTSNIYHIG